MSGRFIDVASWKRRQHYELFRNAANPFFSVTVTVDVTALWQRRAEPGASFTLDSNYALLLAAHGSEAFRLRLRGDQAGRKGPPHDQEVWLHDRVGVGTTVLRSDETFGFARLDLNENYASFASAGRAALAKGKDPAFWDPLHGGDDVIYHSVLPWIRFNSFTNALPGHDSIPRVVFGQVFEEAGGYRMPVGVEVHHALVDGLDIARLLDAFQQHLNDSAWR